MNKISLTPTRDQLVNVGDRITYKNGYIELISIDADGVANLEAHNPPGKVAKFQARRDADGEWEETVTAAVDDVEAHFARPALPTYEDYVGIGEEPKVGEWVEFAGDPGVRHRILGIDGNRALIDTPGRGKHWIDISVGNRSLMGVQETLTGHADIIAAHRNGMKAGFANERMPIARHALDSGGVIREEGDAAELMRTKRDKAHVERELARIRIKNRGQHTWTVSQEDYDRDRLAVRRAVNAGLKLERPQGSSFHHLYEFLKNRAKHDGVREWWDEDFEPFVIESDWARALSTGGGDEDGDFPLPYDHTCFELRVSGLRVLLLAGRDASMMVVGVNHRWYINPNILSFVNGKLTIVERTRGDEMPEEWLMDKIIDIIGAQVRAVCIALDERRVFEQVTVPAGAGLNKQRKARGQSPVRDYHVIRLKARLERAHAPEGGYTRGPLKTWHKRRGHWRHYKDGGSGVEQYLDADGVLRSRTWIAWMFVGDMNGRFIDKEYRL